MKEYPSIPKVTEPHGEICVAFDKLDGSSMRAEWSRKRGWYKFGSRTQLLCQGELAEAETLFMNEYAEPMTKALLDCKDFHKPEGAMAFFEFFGPHSFAGKHDPGILNVQSNEPKQVVVFDVNIHKRGICGPRRFLKVFGHLKIPSVIYDGPLTEEFVLDVRAGKYPVNEGVIAKWGDGFDHTLRMHKIKTTKYLDDIKKRFGADWQRYGE